MVILEFYDAATFDTSKFPASFRESFEKKSTKCYTNAGTEYATIYYVIYDDKTYEVLLNGNMVANVKRTMSNGLIYHFNSISYYYYSSSLVLDYLTANHVDYVKSEFYGRHLGLATFIHDIFDVPYYDDSLEETYDTRTIRYISEFRTDNLKRKLSLEKYFKNVFDAYVNGTIIMVGDDLEWDGTVPYYLINIMIKDNLIHNFKLETYKPVFEYFLKKYGNELSCILDYKVSYMIEHVQKKVSNYNYFYQDYEDKELLIYLANTILPRISKGSLTIGSTRYIIRAIFKPLIFNEIDLSRINIPKNLGTKMSKFIVKHMKSFTIDSRSIYFLKDFLDWTIFPEELLKENIPEGFKTTDGTFELKPKVNDNNILIRMNVFDTSTQSFHAGLTSLSMIDTETLNECVGELAAKYFKIVHGYKYFNREYWGERRLLMSIDDEPYNEENLKLFFTTYANIVSKTGAKRVYEQAVEEMKCLHVLNYVDCDKVDSGFKKHLVAIMLKHGE